MSKMIKNLAVGAKVKDSNGNIFTVASHGHYGTGQTLLFHSNLVKTMQMYSSSSSSNTYKVKYADTLVHTYLQSEYLEGLQPQLKDIILDSTVHYPDCTSGTSNTYVKASLVAKAFVPSIKEICMYRITADSYDDSTFVTYFNGKSNFSDIPDIWTRSEWGNSKYNGYYVYKNNTKHEYLVADEYHHIRPFMNIPSSALVSDEMEGGCYLFKFNEPPTIQNISNITTEFGTPANINYTVVDVDDEHFTHYISIDNGETYIEVTPTSNNNSYSYSYLFNDLGVYYCRIKVADSANNEVISNVFTVTVELANPTINVISANNNIVIFKVGCTTNEISSAEVLVNDEVVKTYESGFNTNLEYLLDKNIVDIGKNNMKIRAISTAGLIGSRDLEIIKEKYPIPPAGTKVEVNGFDYFILSAFDNGDYQTYILTENLKSNVKINDIIKVSQDSVKVLCSLSNAESIKDYKEMKLVKAKKLKGDLEGYVEEKYELQGEGRYSTIKLDMEKFTSSAQTEILELQQYFDYKED